MLRKPQEVRLSDYKAPEFLIDDTNLTFELDEIATHVTSILKVYRNPKSNEKSTDYFLDGEDLTLETVRLNGELLTADRYAVTNDGLRIFNVPDKFTLEIQNNINPSANSELMGLYISNGNFCTQCEAEGFRRITYFPDRPDIKSTYTVTLVADAEKYPILLSNGNLINKGDLVTGKHWFTYEDPIRKSSYLFALAGGKYELLKDCHITPSGRKISLEIYSDKGYGGRLQHAMNALKKALAWDERTYGWEYKLNCYKIVAAKDFNMGAMENQGLNFFAAKCLLGTPETATDRDLQFIDVIVSHEVFHHVTGNEIGPENWFQLSAKEGLTTYREQAFSEDQSGVTARIDGVLYLRNEQFPEDAGPLSHAVQPQSYIEIDNFYTSTVYEKGAEVFRMLRTIVGKDIYRKGTDIYYAENRGKSAKIEDFVKAMELASGKDLSQFMLWFHQAGTPVLDVQDSYDTETNVYTLKISQSSPLPMMIPIRLGLLNHNGAQIQESDTVMVLTQKSEEFFFKGALSKPIPSLFRHCSAPAVVNYNYSDKDLRLLAKYDTDLFNRWDASQRYVMKYLLRLIEDYKKKGNVDIYDEYFNFSDELEDFLEHFRSLFNTDFNDRALQARMLSLPSEDEIANQMDCIDVNAICAVRKEIAYQIRVYMWPEFLKRYKELQKEGKTAGDRALKNLCLSYLTLFESEYDQLAKAQFDQAKRVNMNDTIAALVALNNNNCKQRTETLKAFYELWKEDPIIITKWFAVQASSTQPSTLQTIKSLMNDPVFDFRNPSFIRALVRPFVNNYECFHAATGAGYEFLTDLIMQLNSQNANLASELTENFSQWRKFASPQRELMQKQLQRIMQHPNLSENVYEIASKSLGEAGKVNEKASGVVATLFSQSIDASSTLAEELNSVAGLRH